MTTIDAIKTKLDNYRLINFLTQHCQSCKYEVITTEGKHVTINCTCSKEQRTELYNVMAGKMKEIDPYMCEHIYNEIEKLS